MSAPNRDAIEALAAERWLRSLTNGGYTSPQWDELPDGKGVRVSYCDEAQSDLEECEPHIRAQVIDQLSEELDEKARSCRRQVMDANHERARTLDVVAGHWERAADCCRLMATGGGER